MPVRLKLLAPIAALVALFVLGSGLLFVEFQRLDSQMQQAASHANRLNYLSLRLGQVEERQKTELLSFALSGRLEYLETLTVGNAEAERLLAEMFRIMSGDNAAERLLQAYEAARESLAQTRRELIAAARAGDAQALNATFDRWRRQTTRLDALRNDLLLHINRQPGSVFATMAEAQQRALRNFLLFSLLAALLLIGTAFYYRRLIATPLRRLTAMAERIADGDLDAQLPPGTTRDELSRLAETFNRMTRSLKRAHTALSHEVEEKNSELEERKRIMAMLESANAELAEAQRGLQEEVHHRRISERALMREKERAEVTLMSIGDGVIIVGADGRVESLNPVAEALTGWRAAEAQGQLAQEVFRLVDEDSRRPPDEHPVRQSLQRGVAVECGQAALLLSRDGRDIHVNATSAPIRSADGHVWGAVLVFHDVSESKRWARQVAHQASHDALTGLLNRREFEKRLEHAVRGAREQGAEHVLLYLDLDRFKVVNDTCGHAAGDELLRQLTEKLAEHVRARDTFARLGGDEFGVLLEHCRAERGIELAEQLRRAVLDFRFHWQGRVFSVGASIGMVSIDDHSESADRMLDKADGACYAAKEAGRNRVTVAGQSDQVQRSREQQVQWAERIRSALEAGRLRLHGQRILATRGERGRLHYEVFLTLVGEGGEDIPPRVFMPAAERLGLMSKLDRWVVEHTFQWLVEHPDELQRLHLCSINLCGNSLSDEEFVQFLRDCLGRHPSLANRICFEISEASAVASLRRAREFIETIQQYGCVFSLDDFGSGFSSYAYLKDLPVDFLKIDGSFVKDMSDDVIDFAMVESINRLGHALGKQTIAEFVETQAVLDRLRELGVDYVQGYAVARPQPLDAMAEPVRPH